MEVNELWLFQFNIRIGVTTFLPQKVNEIVRSISWTCYFFPRIKFLLTHFLSTLKKVLK